MATHWRYLVTLRRESQAWQQLEGRQQNEFCSWHVARGKAACHRDPCRSRHQPREPTKFHRDERRYRYFERRRRDYSQPTPLRLTPGVLPLRLPPPGWPPPQKAIESAPSVSPIVNSRFSIAKKIQW